MTIEIDGVKADGSKLVIDLLTVRFTLRQNIAIAGVLVGVLLTLGGMVANFHRINQTFDAIVATQGEQKLELTTHHLAIEYLKEDVEKLQK